MDGMVATVAGVGFVLGLRHALDPDHVVAVTTLASQKIGLRRTSLVGAFWGLGHALSLGLAGGVRNARDDRTQAGRVAAIPSPS